jgi:S1-C subfamily serine protease
VHLNWLDLALIVVTLIYAYGGLRNGALVGGLSFAGFFGGAALGAQLARPVGDRVAQGNAQIPVAIVCVLLAATLGQLVAVWLAGKIKARVTSGPARQVDSVVGSVFAAAAVLLVAWMVALPLVYAPFPGVSSAVKGSRVIHAVDGVLPEGVRNLYSSLRSFVDRSGFPQVFGALQATRIVDVAPADPALLGSPVVSQVRDSVLKVDAIAASCDRSIEGSGFVISPRHVMTNAHVVAGSNDVTVQTGQGRLAARVVLYNPARDVAVLYVPRLRAQPLNFAPTEAKSGADAIVLGYPKDGPFDVRAARVRDREQIAGKDIYGRTSLNRDIYAVRSLVRVGNSGGPLIDTSGRVLGVVFASALDSADTGFALTANEVAPDVDKGRAATAGVSAQGCAD